MKTKYGYTSPFKETKRWENFTRSEKQEYLKHEKAPRTVTTICKVPRLTK